MVNSSIIRIVAFINIDFFRSHNYYWQGQTLELWKKIVIDEQIWIRGANTTEQKTYLKNNDMPVPSMQWNS